MADTRAVTLELLARDQEAAAVSIDGVQIQACTTQATAPCFQSIGHGVIQVQAGARSVHAPIVFGVDLQQVAPVGASVLLVCRNGQTTPGTSVYAVGSIDQLGGWQPTKGVRMTPSAYPTWALRLDNVPANANITWKCVRQKEDMSGTPEWQPGDNNAAQTGASGYSGASFGALAAPSLIQASGGPGPH
jgi:hypothetical protein